MNYESVPVLSVIAPVIIGHGCSRPRDPEHDSPRNIPRRPVDGETPAFNDRLQQTLHFIVEKSNCNHRRRRLPPGLHPYQRRTEPYGGYLRRVDHDTHRHQNPPYPQRRSARHLVHGRQSGTGSARKEKPEKEIDLVICATVTPDRISSFDGNLIATRQAVKRHSPANILITQRISLRTDHRFEIHQEREPAEGDRRGCGQDVVDRRLHRPQNLPHFRRRRSLMLLEPTKRVTASSILFSF